MESRGPASRALQQAGADALREAMRLKQKSIRPDHLLLGILRAPSSGRALLLQGGVDVDALRRALEEQTKAA